MIVLLTDFGQSEYVGIMKGVILSVDPDAKIVDLCHNITPQSIVEASWVLKTSYKYFPRGAVFCCVVDPGVGTERKAVAVQTESYYFVAPDNGLLWETVSEQNIIETRQIPVPKDASRTFHGRDVFAGAAAVIGLGRFDSVGKKPQKIERFELYQRGREGLVVRIDSFGNIVTNIPSLDKPEYIVSTRDMRQPMACYPTYNAAPENELFLIEGSSKTLEISLKNGGARDRLQLVPGTPIEIV